MSSAMSSNNMLLTGALCTCMYLLWKQYSKVDKNINKYQPFVCGCIGGLGPKATAVFYDENILAARAQLFVAMTTGRLEKVREVSTADWTQEEMDRVWSQRKDVGNQLRDQDHISLLIYSNPVIPGRPEFMSGTSSLDPTDAMVHTAQALVDAGSSALCMVCSTAHYFKDSMLKRVRSNVPFLDIIELTFQHILNHFDSDGDIVVGLMGTEPLLRSQVYETTRNKLAGAEKIRIVTPLTVENGDQENFNKAIFGPKGIKAGFDHDLEDPDTFHNFERLLTEVLKMQKAGAVVVILGCTELPLVLSSQSVGEYGPRIMASEFYSKSDLSNIRFVNPTQILADKIIHLSLTCRQNLNK